jgi:two-component sensor histidine kinase
MGKTVTTTGLMKNKNEFPFEMSLSAWQSDGKTYFTSIIRDLTERQKADEQIKKSLEEKEVLIREVHHRVKNNMQIISSLLNLQTRYVDDKETVNLLKESQNRVKSMAMIHEKLYQSHDLNHINIFDYINSLVKDLFYSYAIPKNQIKTVIKVEEINLNIETAVPCGLIISEIISNSLKYAFPGGREGEVHISLKHNGEKLYLTISDNGIGFPEGIDFKNTDSLGLRLVNNLTEQIDGELELDRSHGTKFNITFIESKYKERI